jgi:hypothetical protein
MQTHNIFLIAGIIVNILGFILFVLGEFNKRDLIQNIGLWLSFLGICVWVPILSWIFKVSVIKSVWIG